MFSDKYSINILSFSERGFMNKIGNSFIWKTCERFGVSGMQFVLQIILARLLSPDDYGVLTIMIIFIAVANVFVQNGFNTALVQNKNIEEDDYSSVLWVSLFIALGLYVVIFIASPIIANYYKMPDIILPLRVLALILFPGALNSIQIAKVTREMEFRKIFTSNVSAIVVSGIISIVIAILDGGIWALVIQAMLNIVIATIVMLFTVKIKWKFVCNLKRIKILFSFGGKLMASSLIDTLYIELHALIIGKKYDSTTLGYYNRGKQFPQFIINAINGSVQSVMLPVMSSEQDNVDKVKEIMRTSIIISSYVIFPMMAGLAAVATPLVSILLKDKWLPCVPYLQIYCLSLAFYPVHSCNLQAINAMGRSDVFLKLEIIKKFIGIISVIIAVFLFETPFAIAMTTAFTSIIGCFINAYPNRKLIGYSYIQQIKDMLPAFAASIVVFICVLIMDNLSINIYMLLLFKIIMGIGIYLFISSILKIPAFVLFKDLIYKVIKNQK